MDPIRLHDPHSGSTALIAAEAGFNCYAFQAVVAGATVEVLDAPADFPSGVGNPGGYRPSGYGIPVLFPYPNRIRGGRFEWGGREFALSPDREAFDENGNAIHGFCLDRPWRVERLSEQAVVGEFHLSVDAPDRRADWPADFRIRIRYEVRGTSLYGEVTIENPGEDELPWGFGTHPYFRLPLGEGSGPDRCLIEVPAKETWELIDCLPTGLRRPLPVEKDLRDGEYFDILQFDDILTGLTATSENAIECVILDEAAGLMVSQRCDRRFRNVVVYTPRERNAICLEPYTCITDAVHLQSQGIEAGLEVLPPGEKTRLGIEIRAGEVIV